MFATNFCRILHSLPNPAKQDHGFNGNCIFFIRLLHAVALYNAVSQTLRTHVQRFLLSSSNVSSNFITASCIVDMQIRHRRDHLYNGFQRAAERWTRKHPGLPSRASSNGRRSWWRRSHVQNGDFCGREFLNIFFSQLSELPALRVRSVNV